MSEGVGFQTASAVKFEVSSVLAQADVFECFSISGSLAGTHRWLRVKVHLPSAEVWSNVGTFRLRLGVTIVDCLCTRAGVHF